jgi:hypothetical protein
MEPQQNIQPTANTQVPTPAPAPSYVGNTNIVDRSNQQASIYTPPAAFQPSPLEIDNNQTAKFEFDEAIILVAGVASATAYILILYLVKNTTATAIVSGLLAFLAIFLAIRDYKRTARTSPLMIIGLSAATITIVYIANLLIAYAVLKSVSNGFY